MSFAHFLLYFHNVLRTSCYPSLFIQQTWWTKFISAQKAKYHKWCNKIDIEEFWCLCLLSYSGLVWHRTAGVLCLNSFIVKIYVKTGYFLIDILHILSYVIVHCRWKPMSAWLDIVFQTGYRKTYTVKRTDSATLYCTVKLGLSGHSKIDNTKSLMTNGSFMKVESIAECITFDLH